MQNKKIYLILLVAILPIILIAGLVLAQNIATTDNAQRDQNGEQFRQMQQIQLQQGEQIIQRDISGKIKTINEKLITLESQNSYTITIDASDIDISNLKIGDFIVANGDILIKAKKINNKNQTQSQQTAAIGSVTKIEGSTITITSKKPVNGAEEKIYTIDASEATITKRGLNKTEETLQISDIKEGDSIIVQGETTDNAIKATSVSIVTINNEIQALKNKQETIWSKMKNFFGKILKK